jgi:outer membrane autotransporter protein
MSDLLKTLGVKNKMSLMIGKKIIAISISSLCISFTATTNVYAALPTPYSDVCKKLKGLNKIKRLENQQKINFLDICNRIAEQDDATDNEAVAALRHEEVAVQGNISIASSKNHTNNVAQRINSLHQTNKGGASGDDNGLLSSSRWGLFANVGYNEGNRRKTVEVTGVNGLGNAAETTIRGERAYDTDGKEFLFGIDYRFPNEKFIVGGSVGYNKITSEFTGKVVGNTKLKGQHISAYATYLPSEHLYMDSIVSVGKNAIDSHRAVPVFNKKTSKFKAADGRAFATTDSQQLSISLGMGYEFNRAAWNITPYTRFDYTTTEIDDYTETVRDNNPDGWDSSGMALAVKDQKATSLVGGLGVRTSYPISSSRGVFVPQASLELNYQLKKDERFIDAALPVALGLGAADARAQTSQLDRNYFKLRVGVSAIFPKGHSGFIQLESLQGSDDLSDTAMKAGYRVEF